MEKVKTQSNIKEKFFYGFTLIELLVAVAIVSALAIISVQILFDTVSVKSKQQTLETSSDSAFLVFEQITKAVKEAKSINVPTVNQIEIVNSVNCINYRYNLADKTIEKAVDSLVSCTPTSYIAITPISFEVSDLNFSPIGSSPDSVSLLMVGEIKGALDRHPFKFQTNIYPRVTL